MHACLGRCPGRHSPTLQPARQGRPTESWQPGAALQSVIATRHTTCALSVGHLHHHLCATPGHRCQQAILGSSHSTGCPSTPQRALHAPLALACAEVRLGERPHVEFFCIRLVALLPRVIGHLGIPAGSRAQGQAVAVLCWRRTNRTQHCTACHRAVQRRARMHGRAA